MSKITIRFSHNASRMPITELEMNPTDTIGAMRTMVQDRLASEEQCLMRVISRWYATMVVGSRKWVAEIKDEDDGETVASFGLRDYSEVHLEGPLTTDLEGVAQAIGIMDQRMRQQNSQICVILLRMADGISELVAGQREIVSTQKRVDARLLLQDAADNFLKLYNEAEKVCRDVLAQAIVERQHIPYFTLDLTTPRADVVIENPCTVFKSAGDSWVTLRSFHPLTAEKRRWTMAITGGPPSFMMLGMLPKLSSQSVAGMGSKYIEQLGGWCVYGHDGSARGKWKCQNFSFGEGDVVAFEYNFSEKTLAVSCGEHRVVGHIPTIADGDELYPAVSLYTSGQQVRFSAAA